MFYYSLQKQFAALPAPINEVAEETGKLERSVLIYIKAKIYNTSLRRIYL